MSEFLTAVRKSLNWFCKSGIMYPEDGYWGVGERVVLCDNMEESVMQEIRKGFPTVTLKDKHFIIEARRPDCNFETALLFLLAGSYLNDKSAMDVGINILQYLYNRTCLLERDESVPMYGAWYWNNVIHGNGFWFDDNSWCIMLQMAIARKFPELSKQFETDKYGLILADNLAKALERTLAAPVHDDGQMLDPDKLWIGGIQLPHWGSLAIGALCTADKYREARNYYGIVRRYQAGLKVRLPSLTASEFAYALLGSVVAYNAYGDDFNREMADLSARLLLDCANPDTGTLPAGHYEAPKGTNLVDLIYTVNWSVLALQMYCRSMTAGAWINESEILRQKQMKLLVDIQDKSPASHVNGCWRGMFDMDAGGWGGGNRYEGGECSLYSGWTNAPIAITLLLEEQGSSLAEML